ncbi:MAG: Ig-like domain-containing protein [Janthinobacterium lividum]
MTQYAYVANSDSSGTISILDMVANTLAGSLTTGTKLFGIAASPDGSKIYATKNSVSGAVAVISTSTNAVVATVLVGSYPFGVAVSPDGSRVYVANSNNGAASPGTVSVINAATNAVIATVTVGDAPSGIAVSPDGSTVYVANNVSNTVSVISTSTNAVVATVTVGSAPVSVSISPDGSTVYVANASGSVSVVNASTNAVTATISGVPSRSIAASPDSHKVFAAGGTTSGSLTTLNAATNAVSSSLAVGAYPYGVAVSPDGSTVYVVNASGSVSVVNASTNAVTATISGLPSPSGIALVPPQPPGVVSVVPGVTSLTVATSANPGTGSTSYEIQSAPDVSGTPGSWTTAASGLAASTTNIIISGLSPYTLYWVREVGQGGLSGDQPGPATQVRTLTDIPAITFNSVLQTTLNAVVPAYPADVTAWDLHRVLSGADTVVSAGIAPSSTFADSGLTQGTAYQYYLAGTENGTPNVQGPSATVTTSAAPPPPAPGTPAAPTFGTPTTTTAPVILPAEPANTSSLSLQRAPDSNGSPGTFTTLPGGTGLAGGATYGDTGLTASTKYWYRVIAVGSGGSTTGPYAADMTAAPDTTPPTFSSGSVNSAGNSIAWVFADPTSAGLLPAAPTGLSATADGVAATLGAATVSGMVVTTPITSATIKSGQTVLGSYAPGTLTDNAATPNGVLAFTNVSLTNNSMVVAAIVVSITSPATGSAVQGLVDITVAASGGAMGISRVELYVEGSLVDTETVGSSGSYTCLWDTTAAGNGPYTVFAIAYDNATPPNHQQSASITLNAANPDRLDTGYWFSALESPVPSGTILSAVVTAELIATTDQRALREILFGVTTSATSFDFEADYTVIALNEDFLLPSPSATYRLAAKLQQRYSVGPFTFTEQIVKMLPYGAVALIWAASGKLYSFDGVSAPVLLLDTTTVTLSGETLRDVCAFGTRVFLALSGGPTPITSRLFPYDPATGDENYTILGIPGTVSALTSVGMGTTAALYIGTDSGLVHRLGADGRLKKVCGGTTAALPFGVAALLPVALTANTAPGVTVILTDGSAWDIDGSAVYGASPVYAPPDGHSTAGVIADQTYLASAGGGLYASSLAGLALAYAFPHGVNALASYGVTVYAGLSGDGRLWGKTLTPGAHALAYGPVTDPLGYVSGGTAGLTSITALIVIGGALYVGGTAGAGENCLYEYNAPDANALGNFGLAFKHPSLEVRAFS